jgi:carbamoylphosphate synthase small subunit
MYLMYGWKVVENLYDADLLQFTGGADVTPSLYGQVAHPTTHFNTARDDKEIEIFNTYKGKKPMAGICRGGQFLNVVNGGKMYQDVDGHAIHGTHAATDTRTGKVIQVSSTHHQMMRPAAEGDVLCVASEATYKEHMYGKQVQYGPVGEGLDTEVVLYRDTACLCFQPHPEFVVASRQYRECSDYFFECLEEVL